MNDLVSSDGATPRLSIPHWPMPNLHRYHTALEVRMPEGRFTIENAWPSPDADTRSRGVVLEGPVFNRRLAKPVNTV